MRRPLVLLLGLFTVTTLFVAPPAPAEVPTPHETSDQASGNSSKPPPNEGGEQKAASKQLKYFLHYSGPNKGACEPSTLSISAEDSADAQMCGEVMPSLNCPPRLPCMPQEPDSGLLYALPEKFNHTVYQGYQGRVRLALWFDVPDEATVSGAINVGGLSCFFWEPSRPVMPNEWSDFDMNCQFGGFAALAEPGADSRQDQKSSEGPPSTGPGGATSGTGSLSLNLAVRRYLNYYIGYEGPQAAWLEFGADPPEVQNKTDERARAKETPDGEAPGAGFAFAALGMIALVEVVRRRREL